MALLSDAVLYMLLITTRTLHYTVFVRLVRVHCFSLLAPWSSHFVRDCHSISLVSDPDISLRSRCGIIVGLGNLGRPSVDLVFRILRTRGLCVPIKLPVRIP